MGLAAGYSDKGIPLGSYALIAGAFNAGFGSALLRAARNGRLPERISAGDVALLGVASHKLARLISADTVTSPLRAPFVEYKGGAGINEVSETPRGTGMRRALGELLFCPPCTGQWVAAGMVAGLLRAPRPTRVVAATFAVQAVADFLHVAWQAGRDAVSS